jgi:hypothetical protein
LLLVLISIAGCASTKVTQQTPISSPGLSDDMPANSSIADEVSTSSTPTTVTQIEEGRQLGALIAKDLVADIQEMGLPAIQARA